MEISGWVLMTVSLVSVTTLVVWCYRKILGA